MHKYFWTKESRTLYKKIKKRNIIKFSDVIEIYQSKKKKKINKLMKYFFNEILKY